MKPLFFSVGRLSESLCLLRAVGSILAQICEYIYCMCRTGKNNIWKYHHAEVKDIWNQNKNVKNKNRAHLRLKVELFLRTTSPMWCWKKFWVRTDTLHMRYLTQSTLIILLLSEVLWWKNEAETEKRWWLMLKKETGAYAHKAPSYYTPDTQSICPLTSCSLHRSTHERRLLHMVPFCSARYVTICCNTAPRCHKLSLPDKNFYC